jgi:hypothetical protein
MGYNGYQQLRATWGRQTWKDSVDWFDPDTWKVPAALADHWGKIAGAAVVVAGAVGTFAKWGRAPIRWIWSAAQRTRVPRATKPLRFVLNEHQSLWSHATNAGQPGTYVHGHWYVTNLTDRDFVLLAVRLEGHNVQFPRVMTQAPKGDQFGVRTFASKNPILAGQLSEVAADFQFFPPIMSGRGAFVAHVIFTDNYGDEHRIPSVRFPYRGP